MNGSRVPHARKGREGKGVGSGKEEVKFSTHLISVPESARANECAATRPEVSR